MKGIITLLFIFLANLLLAQYHVLTLPQESPYAKETRRLGVTDITVEYYSPAVRGRQIWGNLVPMNGNPIPWRTGANINTRISFSTDVLIEGQPLSKGSYGFHTIPGEKEWELLFASHDNLWGSYYLDLAKEIVLRIKVKPQQAPHREWMSFEYLDRTDSTLVLAFEWEKVRVPFTIAVDLNKTVLESFRYELRGHTTNAWASWNAAANWCFSRHTNLEEALTWADRSIKGGYGGYRAEKNFTNLSTKASILAAMGRESEALATMKEATQLGKNPNEMYDVGDNLYQKGYHKMAQEIYETAIQKFPDQWYLHLGLTRTRYTNGQKEAALQSLSEARRLAPSQRHALLDQMQEKIKKGASLN